MAAEIFDFSHLTPAERIELAEQLWDSLAPEAIEPSADELQHIRERRAQLAADGDEGEPWEEVIDDIEARGV